MSKAILPLAFAVALVMLGSIAGCGDDPGAESKTVLGGEASGLKYRSRPSRPGTPWFSEVTQTTLTVEWTAAARAATYEVQRAPDSGGRPGAFATIASSVTTTSIADMGLSPETTYWYRVRGRNSSGAGSYSVAASAATSVVPPPGTGGTRGPTYLCPSGGTCIGKTVTGGGSATDAQLIANSYNVVTQGGARGDCSTDDTVALRRAMATATSQRKALYVPAPRGGCYLVHGSDDGHRGTLRVTTHMVGAPGAYPKILMTGAPSRYGNNGILLFQSSATPIIVSGLTLDGGFTNHTVGGYHGTSTQKAYAWDAAVTLWDSSRVTIRNNYIQNAYGDCIEEGSWNDAAVGGSNIIINNNTLRWCTRQSVTMNATGPISGIGTVITNNVIDNAWGYGRILDFEPNNTLEQCYNVEFAYNRVNQYDAATNPSGATWDGKVVNIASASCSGQMGGNVFVHHQTPGSPLGYGAGFYLGRCWYWRNVIVDGTNCPGGSTSCF